MADIFKDGILYMDDLHDSDILKDILEEQNKEDEIEKELELKKEQQNKEIKDIQQKSKECLLEMQKKLKETSDSELLFDENNRVVCSNNYSIEIVEENNISKVYLIIPK